METGKENGVLIPRASRKRARETMENLRPHKKKRVVLGELPNSSNAVVSPSLSSVDVPRKLKREIKPKSEGKEKEDDVVVDNCAYPLTDADIYEYLRHLEVDPKRTPLPDYLERVQDDVNQSMREILVDWLVEVAEHYKLVSDTLYLTVMLIDRFLSFNVLTRQKLQLLGVSAMLIASKYEEISPPKVDDFVDITDNTYTSEEVISMEIDVLKSLKHDLGNATVWTFLKRFVRVAKEDYEVNTLRVEFLAYYLAELSLLAYQCVRFLPSMVAASCIFLARFIIHPAVHPWNTKLQEYSRYRPSELKDCVKEVHNLFLRRQAGGVHAVCEKYKDHKFKCVAKMASPLDIPSAFFEDIKE